MVGSLFGMTVAREIPTAVLGGLVTGQYSLHGGVIRWAADTAQAGQIVCHLLPAASLLAPAALTGAGIVAAAAPVAAIVAGVGSVVGAIGSGIAAVNTFRILSQTKRTIALAEMNLAVTQAGFRAIEQRLDQLERKLGEVKATVDAIHRLMQIEQRAELRAALDSLSHVHLLTDPDVRIKTLVGAAASLTKIGLIYEDRVEAATSLTEAMACEEYFCLAVIAQARCYAELHEPARALSIMAALEQRWLKLARHIAKQFLLGDHPEQLLHSDFAKSVSVVEIANWLDFIHGTELGLQRIDTLREFLAPWYFTRWPDLNPSSRKLTRSSDVEEAVRLHETMILPAMRKLVSRSEVLQSYVGQFELMKQANLTAAEFEAELLTIDEKDSIDGFIILHAPLIGDTTSVAHN